MAQLEPYGWRVPLRPDKPRVAQLTELATDISTTMQTMQPRGTMRGVWQRTTAPAEGNTWNDLPLVFNEQYAPIFEVSGNEVVCKVAGVYAILGVAFWTLTSDSMKVSASTSFQVVTAGTRYRPRARLMRYSGHDRLSLRWDDSAGSWTGDTEGWMPGPGTFTGVTVRAALQLLMRY